MGNGAFRLRLTISIIILIIMSTTNRSRKPSVKLTKEQRAEVKSLIEDSGYTRAEAVAWVTTFPGASQPESEIKDAEGDELCAQLAASIDREQFRKSLERRAS